MATIREILYQSTKGFSNRQISKSYMICRKTVGKYVTLAKEKGLNNNIDENLLNEIAIKVQEIVNETSKNKGTIMIDLNVYKDKIGAWLNERNITHTQIQRLLAGEGLNVSERSVNRFIKNNFANSKKYTVHLTTNPGQEGQVDFGYVGMMRNKEGNLRKTYAFVMTLSHSRHHYVEFVFSQNQVTWSQLHINAYKFFGGTPLRIILDNLKAGVIKPDIYDPTINETYSELSRFYGFAIDPAKAYKPEHKGKVERSIRIVKEQLIAGRSYIDINAANIEAIKWCSTEISHRICSSTGKKPIELFEQEEKVKLHTLPSGFFDIAEWSIAKVHRDHHFVIKGNFYSVPTRYIGEEISVRIGLKTVSAYCRYKIIKTHPRNFGKGQWITDLQDYPKAVLEYLEKTPGICLEIASTIGNATHQTIQYTLNHGTKVGLRKAQAILRLADKYGKERLEAACMRANQYNNYSYESLRKILSNKLDKIGSVNPLVAQTENLEEIAYIRSADEYSSDMEVNYV